MRYIMDNISLLYYTHTANAILTMDCHPDHEEGDQDVDNVEPHQGVFRTRESTAHFHFLCL